MKSRWPLMIFLAFSVVVSVNGLLFYFAKSTHDKLVESESPYQKGLTYDRDISAKKTFEASGLVVNLAWPKVTVSQRRGVPPHSSSAEWRVVLKALRTNDSNLDFSEVLSESTRLPGEFRSARITDAVAGFWFIRLEFEKKNSDPVERMLWTDTVKN